MTQQLHRPPHIYQNDTWYFISAHTHKNQFVLNYPGHKNIFMNALRSISEMISFKISAWVILDNHYHLLMCVKDSGKLAKFINHLNGRTSFQFNKIEGCKGRKVWYSYWDRLVRDETDYWTKFNYIHYNPVKHGYVADPADWEYSSYGKYFAGGESRWLKDCWEAYPFMDCDFE
ncbi:transposase [bacterium]|nr:transposase [bacterium]